MNDLLRYELIQQRLNFYSCYIKRLLASICEDFDEASIYGSRVIQVVNRLMQQEDPAFLNFFNGDRSKGAQLLHYLERAGEVIHESKGFYSLPPIRTVRFDSGNEYNVSVLNEKTTKTFGLTSLNQKKSSLTLHVNDYLYRPTYEELLTYLGSNLEVIPKLVPTKIFRFKGDQPQLVEKNKLHSGEFVLLQVGKAYYFAKYTKKKWCAIALSNHYRRLVLALYNINGCQIRGKITNLNSDVLILKLDKSLPQDEQGLLSLIALPDFRKNAKTYVFNKELLKDVKEVLENCDVLLAVNG